MSQLNAKAFNGMKQKIKKLTRTHDKKLAEVREASKQEGGGQEEEEEEESSSSSSEDEDDEPVPKGKAAFMKAPAKKAPAAVK
ncbi:MAG: hypothetical protein SGPRY_013358, partial [Prymnesium sp.]